MSKPKFDVLTFGSIVLDIIVRVPETAPTRIDLDEYTWEIPLGDKIRVDESKLSLGGGSGNSSTGFSKLGLKSAIFGVVGDRENQKFLLHHLHDAGVNTKYLTHVKDETSSLSVILNSHIGDRTVFHKRTTCAALGGKDAKDLPSARAIYTAHLYDCTEPILEQIPTWKGQQTDAIWGWNPGKTQFKKGFSHFKHLFPFVDALILNKEEAEQFSGLKANKVELEGEYPEEVLGKRIWVPSEANNEYLYDVWDIAQHFLDAGVKTVAITDGIRGAQVFNGEEHYFSPCQIAKRKDTLGAGDAFSVGLLSAKLHGKDLATQIRWANENANSVIQYIGAQQGQLTLKEMEKRINS